MEIGPGHVTIYTDSAKQAALAKAQGLEPVTYTGNPYTGENSNYPGDGLEDKNLRNDPARSDWERTEGKLCITIKPGSEYIGDIEMCVQYEGPTDTGNHEPDLCVHRQNDLMLCAADWLAKYLLDTMDPGSEWEIDVDAHPCPKSDVPLQIPAMLKLMAGEIVIDVALANSLDETVEHAPSIANEVALEAP
jgi:hypothetical protein